MSAITNYFHFSDEQSAQMLAGQNGRTTGLIYAIECPISGGMYIGSSICTPRINSKRFLKVPRFKQHYGFLSRNQHAVEAMQRDWNHYGKDAFGIAVISMIDMAIARYNWDQMRHYILSEEVKWHQKLQPTYSKGPSNYRIKTLDEIEALGQQVA
jgi:hypothetical protein